MNLSKTLLLLLLFFYAGCSRRTPPVEPNTTNAPLPVYLRNFENKNQILEWGKKEFGYIGDSININVGTKAIFVLLGDYYSGVRNKTIFVFLKREEKRWQLLCMRSTNTSKVKIDLNAESREIVFKAKSGKIFMILPYETIELDYDNKEQ
jgi:hypothetical protein